MGELKFLDNYRKKLAEEPKKETPEEAMKKVIEQTGKTLEAGIAEMEIKSHEKRPAVLYAITFLSEKLEKLEKTNPTDKASERYMEAFTHLAEFPKSSIVDMVLSASEDYIEKHQSYFAAALDILLKP